jgi:hypothetical protein
MRRGRFRRSVAENGRNRERWPVIPIRATSRTEMGNVQSTAERCGTYTTRRSQPRTGWPSRRISPWVGGSIPGERLQERALAGAVRPEDADGFTAGEDQIDRFQRRSIAEMDAEAARFEPRLGSRSEAAPDRADGRDAEAVDGARNAMGQTLPLDETPCQ